jgi:hypothetical protein
MDARHQDEIPYWLEPYQRGIMILMIQATAHGARPSWICCYLEESSIEVSSVGFI